MIKTHILKADILLGAAILLFALIVLFVWIPIDIDTGLVEQVRRRNVIGDSLGPVVAMLLVGVAALTLMGSGHNSPLLINQGRWYFVFGFFVAVFAIALVIIRFAGPAFITAANEFTGAELSYRNLRNVWPLKYLGYMGGGTFLLCALSHFMDSSLTRKRAVLFFAICFAIALFFDLPFEDILLPPNGDV